MKIFEIRAPRGMEAPVIVSMPHTGTYIPETIAATLAFDVDRYTPGTDWHMHHLYDFLPELGITSIYATHSRLVADLNRPADGRPLYPGRFETGVVSLTTPKGRKVFREDPDAAEIARRVAAYHAPYHQALQRLIDEKIQRFGQVLLVDAHSVASGANLIHGRLEQDIFLGNRDGASCAMPLLDWMRDRFEAAGYMTSQNHPYKGGFITDHYGRQAHVQALQIEMCQRAYMDEDDPAGGPDHPLFDRMRRHLQTLFGNLLADAAPLLAGHRQRA